MSYTCNLIFAHVPFTKERNFIFDEHFETYLDNMSTLSYEGFQVLKFDEKMKIKINCAYPSFLGAKVNYVKIKITMRRSQFSWDVTRYYFVTSAKYVAMDTTELALEIDTLNTYQSILSTLTKRTNVIREHRDRFRSRDLTGLTGIVNFAKNIDWRDEGFSPTLYKGIQHRFTQSTDVSYYLIYKAKSELSAGASFPVSVSLCSEKKLEAHYGIPSPEAEIVYQSNVLPSNKYLCFFRQDNANLKIVGRTGSNTESIIFDGWTGDEIMVSVSVFYNHTLNTNGVFMLITKWRQTSEGVLTGENLANGTLPMTTSYFITKASAYRALDDISTITNDNSITPYEIEALPLTYVNIGVGNYQYSLDINSVDRSDSRLMKIIGLPYSPSPVSVDENGVFSFGGFLYNPQTHLYESTSLNNEFLVTINGDNTTKLPLIQQISIPLNRNDMLVRERNLSDPKLYSPYFYSYKLVYDSFSMVVDLSRCIVNNPDVDCNINITFKPTNAISCKFLFHWISQGFTYKDNEDYERYMIVNRSNELPLLSSSYLDYLRNGYNYDVKNKQLSDVGRWLGFGLGTGSSVLGAALGGKFGMAQVGGIATSLGNSIISQMKEDNSFEKTLHQKSMQSASVSGADDYDLMNSYGGNSLYLRIYQARGDILDSLDNYFYYYGYATNEFKIPDLSTRCHFNFLECSADFDKDSTATYPSFAIDEYKIKLKEGVTYFHFQNSTYDTDQILENYEMTIIG